MTPLSITVEYASTLCKTDPGAGLTVHCPECKIVKLVDLLALKLAGHEKHRIADLKFTCEICGSAGVPWLSWWNGGMQSVKVG